jgi:hypothetical protein
MATRNSDRPEASSSSKTYKREVAIAILVYVGVIGGFAAWDQPLKVLEIVMWPSLLFIAAAFGMDFAAKQTDLLKR